MIKYPLHSLIETSSLGTVEVVEVINVPEFNSKPVYILYDKQQEGVYILDEGDIVEKEKDL